MKKLFSWRSGAITVLLFVQTLLAAEPQLKRKETGRVESVSDGDTFLLVVTEGEHVGEKLKVRVALVDAPEVQHGRLEGQPWGDASRYYLESLIENRRVRIFAYETSYGRLVSIVEVWYNGKWLLVNELIAANGMGEFYEEYSDRYPKSYSDKISASANDAKAKLRGVWVQGDAYVRPSDFRHSQQN